MAQSKNTKTIVVDKDIANQLKQMAEDNGFTMLDLANALLRNAMALAEIEMVVKNVKLKLPKSTAKRSK